METDATRRSHGWYGFALTIDQTASMIAGLRQAADRYGRPTDIGLLEISVTPRRPLDAATVDAYAALGVPRLIPLPDGRFTRAISSFGTWKRQRR